MPFISKVVTGELKCLSVFGNDYNTPDGTGVRDYIHVVDLAKAHVKGIEKLDLDKKGMPIYNLGTGKGYSVLEMIKAFEKANNVKVNYKIVGRRLGDIATCYADPSKAQRELNWKTELGLEETCKGAYNFTRKLKK